MFTSLRTVTKRFAAGVALTTILCGFLLLSEVVEVEETAPCRLVGAYLLGLFQNVPAELDADTNFQSRVPLQFEWRQPRSGTPFEFAARGDGYTILLSGSEVRLAFDRQRGGKILKARIEGARAALMPEPLERLPGKVNYFLGNRPEDWLSDVPTFARVRYRNVYPGIDVVYYGNAGFLEHDFIVQPNADPALIALNFEGADRAEVNNRGDIALHMGSETVYWKKPIVYQQLGDRRRDVAARYRMLANGRIGFETGPYDAKLPLVIDPIVATYSTYIGRSRPDTGIRVAVDASGNAYVVGWTHDGDYPVSSGALKSPSTTSSGNVTLTKFSADGKTVLYTTHIGGDLQDQGFGVALDASGNLFLTGLTMSPDFPVTTGAFRTTHGGTVGNNDGSDCFVMKLNAAGNGLIYSTFLGGRGMDLCSSIALDSAGNAYVTGTTASSNFPVTSNAPQTNLALGTKTPLQDAFVTKLNATGTAQLYSSYLGGNGAEWGLAIAVDSANAAYVSGFTSSNEAFPITPDAVQTRFGGSGPNKDQFGDAFVVKMAPNGSIAYGSYLGGDKDDMATGIALDGQGNIYVCGNSASANFPVSEGAYQNRMRGTGGQPIITTGDGFLTKLTPAGRLSFSTYVGGANDDAALNCVVDGEGRTWLSGATVSRDFPTTADARQTTYGGQRTGVFPITGDAFATQLDKDGKTLLYSTYLGGSGEDFGMGIALDRSGAVYVAGGTTSTNFPSTPEAAQNRYGGTAYRIISIGDGFLVRLGEPPVVTPPPVPPPTQPPSLSISSIGSAASYVTGNVAPGELVVIMGVNIGPEALAAAPTTAAGQKLPTTIAETRVLFDDIAAPLLYVSAKQVGAVAPFSLAGKTTTQLRVEYKGERSAAVATPVVATHPGLFTANSAGVGLILARNEDSSYNTQENPALAGSVITIYGTGGGVMDPPAVDGEIAADAWPQITTPVVVSFGDVPATEIYSVRNAAGQVAGFFQIQLRLPETVPAGNVAVTVKIGDALSQPGALLAVSAPVAAQSARRTK